MKNHTVKDANAALSRTHVPTHGEKQTDMEELRWDLITKLIESYRENNIDPTPWLPALVRVTAKDGCFWICLEHINGRISVQITKGSNPLRDAKPDHWPSDDQIQAAADHLFSMIQKS